MTSLAPTATPVTYSKMAPLCSSLGHNKGKWSNKFSAVEIIIDHIYIMPTPLRPTNALSEMTTMTTTTDSASSTPTTTPIKKPRLTSINLD